MARQRKLERDIRIPLEYGFDVFGGRWKSRIIGAMAYGKQMRYGELKAAIDGISDTALAAALKELAIDGMVRREVISDAPVAVGYSLTEKGESVIPILHSICEWSVRFYPDVAENALDKCKTCPVFLYAGGRCETP